MASLQERKRKNGKRSHLVQFTLNGRRRSVFLDSKYTRSIAKEVSFFVDELASAAEFDMPLTRRVQTWLENIDGDLRERLGRAGLIASNKNVSVGELIELYMEAESPEMKPTTIQTKRRYFRQASERLDFYRKATRISSGDVVALKASLDRDFSEATRAGILKAMSRVYSWAKNLKYVTQNPFAAISKGSFENKSREVFVSMETYNRLVAHCRDSEIRVLLSFYRVGGMRLGEAFEARWEDVDWDSERLTVRSPKTERAGKAFRVIPLFDEIRVELERLKSETSNATGFIIRKRREKTAIYRAVTKLCGELGIPVWERLIQNLRASRANEIFRDVHGVAESEWIGHTTQTARQHYLHLLPQDYAKALGKTNEVAKMVAEPTGIHRN